MSEEDFLAQLAWELEALGYAEPDDETQENSIHGGTD